MMRVKRVHLLYWLGIAIAIIIALASNDLSKKADIYNVLSFALTFASLILAIIAIIQSLVANNSSASVLTAVQAAADQTRAASQQIEASADELRTHVQEIPSRLNDLAGKVDKTHTAIDAFASSRALKELVADEADSSGNPVDEAKAYLRRCTIGGALSWHVVVGSLDRDVEVDIDSITPDSAQNNYIAGFIAANAASGDIEMEKHGSKIKVKSINKPFGSYLSSALKDVFTASEKKDKNQEKLLLRNKNYIDRELDRLSSLRELERLEVD